MKGISVSNGNMYDWVTHMWSPIVGCSHQCSYCYVRNRFRDLPIEASLKPRKIKGTDATMTYACYDEELTLAIRAVVKERKEGKRGTR